MAPGPRAPRRSLACGRFAPGANRSFAPSAPKAKAPPGPWGLSRRFAFGFCPARRSQSLRPGTPPAKHSAQQKAKGQGFARLRRPCLFFASRSRVSFCGSFACALSPLSWAGSPPPGPSYRRSLFSRLRWPAPFGLPRAFRRRGSRLVAIAPGARCASLPPRRFLGGAPLSVGPMALSGNFLGGKYHNEFAESKAK